MKSLKRLIVVSEFVDEEINSTGLYWNKIIQCLETKKLTIEIISSKSSIERSGFQSGNYKLHKVDPPQINSDNFFFSSFNKVIMALFIFYKVVVKTHKNDLVLSGTNPNILMAFIATFHRFMRFKWLILVHDIFPENTLPPKILTKTGILYKALKLVFDFSYSRPDHFISIGRDMSEIISTKTDAKITYIPNFFDFNHIEVVENHLHNNEYISLAYSGNFGKLQDIDNIFKAICILGKTDKKFFFSGNGTYKNRVKDFCDKNENLGVKFLDDGINNNLIDISIVPLIGGMYGLAVPSKAYFSLGHNKPLLVVGDSNSELHLTIKENNDIGWFTEAGNPKALANLINSISRETLQSMTNKPKLVAQRSYSYEVVAKQYRELINQYL